MEFPPAYLAGIQLFNSGHYWHAHEQWEACWLEAAEPFASFYKGMIQTAAALVKWQQGNRRGFMRNWAKSRVYLTSIPQHFLGLDLAALIGAMDAFVSGEISSPPQLCLNDAPEKMLEYMP
ncbi:DUF309 domain-containing protein [Candidatus Gracilibacteria bacterium]|nr:DUF309 domain-containing protein [Candidatus Gracilibacteria bacterium]